jgi:4-hydroxy-tetrahydrodipicolinate synthase
MAIEKGIYAATLTPIDADFQCNADALADHCLELLSRGCKGVVLFGTTGEGCSFTTQEKKRVIQEVVSKGLESQKIIIASGSACLQDTIDLSKFALQHKCLASLIVPPSFFKHVTEEGILAFYREAIRPFPQLPVILYHIPQFSGVPLTLNIVKTLCREFPNIIGLKESEGNLSFTKSILENVPDVQVFVGMERQIPEAVSYGASGAICGMANIWPEVICKAYETGDATEVESLSEPLRTLPFIPYFKKLLAAEKGHHWQRVVPPLSPLT